jgi:hypothetical protein
MGPVTFVIAIMGCADGSAACTPLATLPARYESQAQCAANTSAALTANTEFDYPTLMAECRPARAPASTSAPEPRPSGAAPVRRS